MAPVASKIQRPLGKNLKEMAAHFASLVLSLKKGKVLVGIWSAGLTVCAIAALRKARRKSVPRTEKTKRARPASLTELLKPLLKIAFPSLLSKTSIHLLLYTVLLCARILLTIKIAKITGALAKTVGARTFDTMFELQVIFGLWCMPAAVVNSFLNFENSELAFSIREKLVKHAHQLYLSNYVFYRSGNLGQSRIEDVDQRITQDIKKFCAQFAQVYGNLLKPILEVVLYSRTLAALLGGRHLAAFFVFFLVAGQFLRFVMPPFSAITAETQRLEGEFRSHHHRVIGHAEEIAFYGGGERERSLVDGSFERVKRILRKTYFLRAGMGILDQYLVKHGASMIAYSVMMPAVYLGLHGLKDKPAPVIMQYYITSTSLFLALGAACKHLVLSYKRIQDLSGLTVRVNELFGMLSSRAGGFDGKEDVEHMKALAAKDETRVGGPPKVIIGSHIKFENLDLFSPTGALLVRGLNFAVKENSNVLISGPNGSGKSSLFRVLGGLWPVCSGTLTKPARDKLFYIPQQPYLAPGTLRDQVTYPLSLRSDTEDLHLRKLMAMVNLEYIIEREGGWESEREWADVLSGGEKQRVAMARLFYHRPAFGILDECTSAVSSDVESKIYETCKELGITIFTVSHRPQLRHHHDFQLRFDGEGGWEWSAIEA